jgi:hypothetical protein
LCSVRWGIPLGMCVVVLASASPVYGAHDRGVPFVPARPRDAAHVAGATTEFWRVRAVGPRSRAVVSVVLWSSPDPYVLVRWSDPGRGVEASETLGASAVRRRPAGVRLVGPAGPVATLERAPGGWRLAASSPTLRLNLRLERPVRGVTAGPWRLGPERGRAAALRWSSPAVIARARGRVSWGGRTSKVRQGRGYLDHSWGRLDLERRSWQYWDLAQLATGRRSGVVLHGLDRMDEVSGPGSADAVFRGVLTRVAPHGTTSCRPRVVRRRWTYGLDDSAFALRMRASCGGRSFVFDTPRDGFFSSEDGDYWRRMTTLALGRRRGVGTFDHFVWTF